VGTATAAIPRSSGATRRFCAARGRHRGEACAEGGAAPGYGALRLFTAREMGKVFFTNSGSEANDSQV
jgi:hypothetical protein